MEVEGTDNQHIIIGSFFIATMQVLGAMNNNKSELELTFKQLV
jgi:hypothetical protein